MPASRLNSATKKSPTKKTTRKKRSRVAGKKRASEEASQSQGMTGDYGQRIADHRLRLESIEAILDSTLGESARSNPSLWDRHAYLLLVGHVYERLATGGADISTEELLKLARTLAENRRADAQALKQAAHARVETASEAGPSGAIPDRFIESIQRVYGLSPSQPHADATAHPDLKSESKNGGAGG